jgi:hypothetical protein
VAVEGEREPRVQVRLEGEEEPPEISELRI